MTEIHEHFALSIDDNALALGVFWGCVALALGLLWIIVRVGNRR